MIDYSSLYPLLKGSPLEQWGDELETLLKPHFTSKRQGKFPRWLAALESLPKIEPSQLELNSATVSVGDNNSCDQATREKIKSTLKEFHPWRKGPFNIHGVHIDTEWRSDWKWDRLVDHIQPLNGRRILDVGCGSGYHCWRMAGAGAELVIGIDPTLVFVMQYHALRHFFGAQGVYVLPFALEDLPPRLQSFDTVFSMGVLYHRRSPLDHLMELKDCLKPGGELVLETLVVDGELGYSLMSEGRYAQMRNVWFIPSCPTLEHWLQRCGFKDIRVVDVTTTTVEEQHATEWMEFDSLANFLDPDDASLTIEGYPAPKRATIVARGG